MRGPWEAGRPASCDDAEGLGRLRAMAWVCLSLVLVSFAVAAPLTWVMMRLGTRLRMLDSAGVAGQVKAARRAIPNTGGVAVFWAIALPMAVGLAGAWLVTPEQLTGVLNAAGHVESVRTQTPLALVFLACLLGLHIMGLIDDRRPLGPYIKLGLMTLAAGVMVIGTRDTRLLTLVDAHVGGPWASMVISIAWIVVVTNALNFMDNMDGLSAGAAMVAAGGFLVAAMMNEQWSVCASLALLIGACAGFLVFNFPPARIFMGDGGSLVLGFTLAILTIRTTYYTGPTDSGRWYAACMPIVVLAVPLYDFISVVAVRLSQGKSPFVGDLQHLSHRLVRRGLSKRAAVVVIHALTGVTGVSGVLLAGVDGWRAGLVVAQVVALLAVIAAIEWSSSPARRGGKA